MKLSQELIDKIEEVACEKLNEYVELDFCIHNFVDFLIRLKSLGINLKIRMNRGTYIFYREVANIDRIFAIKNSIIDELRYVKVS